MFVVYKYTKSLTFVYGQEQLITNVYLEKSNKKKKSKKLYFCWMQLHSIFTIW